MIIDLFAGPGGWSTGLNMIGRAETVGIEWDKAACDTARAAGHERMQADIAELDPFTIGGTDVEGIIASPPCQGFSMAGKGKGREDSARLIAAVGDFAHGDPRATLHATMTDDRSLLALEPLRWVLDLEPEWTTWEQVPAVLPLWEACAEVLRADGYDVWTGLVQAETLGVPQTRKRAILRARRGVLEPLPDRAARVTIGDVLPHWPAGSELRHLRGAGMIARYGPRRGRTTDQQSMTVTSKARSWELLTHGLPARQISIAEASLLQTFPANYPWTGSRSAQFRQLGDAVPPLMAAHILASVGAGELSLEAVA
jgi:DNA (cytosine-5)-methyltransferase 1